MNFMSSLVEWKQLGQAVKTAMKKRRPPSLSATDSESIYVLYSIFALYKHTIGGPKQGKAI